MSYRILDDRKGYEELRKLWSEILEIPAEKLNEIKFIESKQLVNNISKINNSRKNKIF